MTASEADKPPPYGKDRLALFALAVSPIAGAIAGMSVLLLLVQFQNAQDFEFWSSWLEMAARFGVVIGWPLSIFVGAPMHSRALKKGRVRLMHYVRSWTIAGLIISLASIVFLWWLGVYVVFLILLMTLSAAASGIVFWLIRRPDGDTPNLPQK